MEKINFNDVNQIMILKNEQLNDTIYTMFLKNQNSMSDCLKNIKEIKIFLKSWIEMVQKLHN